MTHPVDPSPVHTTDVSRTPRPPKRRRAPPGDPKVAVGYLRASTDEQHLSPEAQKAGIEVWADRESVSVVAWHVDQGVSGSYELDDRPGLLAALGELRVVRAGILVIATRSRLARDVIVAALIERAVQAEGARLISADGVANGDAPEDGLMRKILDAFNEYERALIRARTKAALKVKKTKGELTGSVPFGRSLASDGRTLVEHSGEQEVVNAVLELRRRGLSLRAIVGACRERGIVSRSGQPLGKTSVERMLRTHGKAAA